MSNLLDKASIILTPTAYNNGEALCVKPSDGSGDFDFSRNSAATRVNAQGLVENVQILSSNLVQNGDFSEEGVQEISNGSFSQEGSELVTNGDFATDSDWFKSGQVTIGGGVAYFDSDGTFTQIAQNLSGISGKSAKVVIEITEYNQGTLKVLFSGGAQQNLPTSVGTHTLYFSNVASNTLNIARVGGVTNIKIDNVSVREVGQDWDIVGTGWSIGENKIVSVNGSNYGVHQSAIVSGKTYKITYEVKDYVSGNFSIRANTVSGSVTASANGTYTDYITSNGNFLRLMGNGAFNGSVTNISVKEVGQNWTLGSGWSIGEDKANGTSATGVLYTNITITSSNKARIKADVDISGGGIQLRVGGVSLGYFYDNIDYVFTSNGNGLVEFVGQSFTGSITNISVIEITTDTSLPRINYEGFSYQDALGSEEVVNGGFDSDTAWSKGAGWSIANGEATHTGGASYLSQSILNPNTQYKVKIKVSQASGSNFVQIYMGGSPASVLIQNVGEYEYIFTSQSSIGLGFALRGAGNVGIDNVSVKEYLGQEVVPDSGCGSWLFEPQSTNLITQSELFSDASWAKLGNSSFGFVTGIAPNGATSVYEITSDGGGGKLQYTISGLAINTEYTLSFYAKKESDITLVQSRILSLTGGSGGTNLTTVNYQNDLITDQWVRITHTFTTNDTLGNYILYISNALTSGDTLQLWGAQVEALSYATSYIPTSGSTVTRNQDVCTNGGSLASINSTEGVLYAEIARSEEENLYRLLGIDDGTSNNYVKMGFENSRGAFWIRAVINGVTSISSDNALTSNPNEFYKIAIRYQSGNSAIYINGTSVLTTTTTFSSGNFTALDFNHWNNSLNFFGKTKAVAVWKEALSDQELTELTTI